MSQRSAAVGYGAGNRTPRRLPHERFGGGARTFRIARTDDDRMTAAAQRMASPLPSWPVPPRTAIVALMMNECPVLAIRYGNANVWQQLFFHFSPLAARGSKERPVVWYAGSS